MTYNEETRLLTPSEGCVILRKENDWMLPDGIYLGMDDSVEDFYEKTLEEVDKTRLPNFLEPAKRDMLELIEWYDKSSAVNEFTLGGSPMWLHLEERKSMRQSLIALKARGVETFTYWNGMTPVTMPVSQFEAIMDAVEVYALQCFNVTAQHKTNVMALRSTTEVDAYDYKAGYPEKLVF